MRNGSIPLHPSRSKERERKLALFRDLSRRVSHNQVSVKDCKFLDPWSGQIYKSFG